MRHGELIPLMEGSSAAASRNTRVLEPSDTALRDASGRSWISYEDCLWR
jgi:hypothetical protein